MKNNKVRKTLILAIFTAAALIIFLVEAQIPVIIAVPGIKLGLSNIIVLITLYFYGRKEAAAVLALKIILGSVFSGQLMSFLYSAAGGLLCLVVMALFKKLISEKQNVGHQRLRRNSLQCRSAYCRHINLKLNTAYLVRPGAAYLSRSYRGFYRNLRPACTAKIEEGT
jgi:hypothetical protein